MPTLQRHGEVVHIAFDAREDLLVAGVLRPGEDSPTIERVFNDEPSIRRFVGGFRSRGGCTCYEAGPCGYELQRLLHFAGGVLRGHRPRRSSRSLLATA
jgi:hypothetical protein